MSVCLCNVLLRNIALLVVLSVQCVCLYCSSSVCLSVCPSVTVQLCCSFVDITMYYDHYNTLLCYLAIFNFLSPFCQLYTTFY